jgi:ribosome-associated heat shock protein Hsp15
MTDEASARVDQWLWSIRLATTRTEAGEVCRAGHVTVNGRPAKPATVVRPGDLVEVRIHGRDRVVEVVRPITKRVGAPVAVDCYVDHSPPPPPPEERPLAPLFRPRGTGRPTKRERRQLEAWRGLGPPQRRPSTED